MHKSFEGIGGVFSGSKKAALKRFIFLAILVSVIAIALFVSAAKFSTNPAQTFNPLFVKGGAANATLTITVINDGSSQANITVVNISKPAGVGNIICPASPPAGWNCSQFNASIISFINNTDTGIAAAASKTFTFNITALASSGNQSFNLSTYETHAGSNFNSTLLNVTVDATAPVITAHSNITNIEATSASGAVVSYGTAYTDNYDAPGNATCVNPSGSTFALGLNVVTCNAQDSVGNSALPTYFNITVVDTTPPVLVNTSANLTVQATSHSGATVTYIAPNSTDVVDGVVAATCTNASGSTFPFGNSIVTCGRIDSSGNVAVLNTTFNVTVVDTTPPTIQAKATQVAEATNASGANVTFGTVVTDNYDSPGNATCSPASGSRFFALGTTSVTCGATDANNNVADNVTFNVVVQDTTAPLVVNQSANLSAQATSGSGAIVSYVPANTTDAVDGVVVAVCVPASGSIFALGNTVVTCGRTDANNNVAINKTFNVTVVDTTAPVLFNVSANLSAEATSAGGASVSFVPPNSTDLVDGVVAATCSKASGATFALGLTVVTCGRIDTNGNVAALNLTFNVTVVDTTAPVVVNVSANLTAQATSGSGAVVTYVPANSTDAYDGVVAATCSPSTGSTFALGNNVVTCGRIDTNGNVAALNLTFNVTVVDTTAPIVVNQSANLTAEATSHSGAVVSYVPANSTDAYDGVVAATCSPSTGSTFALGNTIVTCGRTDTNGNVGINKTFNVTVRDTTAPVIVNTSANRTVQSALGVAIAVTYPVPNSTDAYDGMVAANCSKASGSTFNMGNNIVTCGRTDTNGNVATNTTFNITLVDTTPPVITVNFLSTTDTTPELTGTVNDPNAVVGVTVNSQYNTATNNGDGTWTLADGTLTTLALGTYSVTVNATDLLGNTATDVTSDELNIADTAYKFLRGPIQQLPRYSTLISNYELGAITGWSTMNLSNFLNSSAGASGQRLTTTDVNAVWVYDGSEWTTYASPYVWNFDGHDSSFVGYYVLSLNDSSVGKYIRHN